MTAFDRFTSCLVAIAATICPLSAWSDDAQFTLDVEYSVGLGSSGSWHLIGRIDDTHDGANGEFGLSAVRFFLTDIDFGTAGESISLSPGTGAIDPINPGQPNQRPPAILRDDGLIDLIYGQDLSESNGNAVVFGVGVSGDTLLATGTFSPGMSPGFGRDSDASDAAASQALFLPAGVTPIVSGALRADRTLTRVIDNISVLGDYTGDGLVDAADYTAWRDHLGSTANLAADGDGDQVIDDDDYLIWSESYASGPRSQATPEPSSCLLATIGVMLTSLWRCRASA